MCRATCQISFIGLALYYSFAVTSAGATGFSFTLLGTAGFSRSFANGISADGSTVVGSLHENETVHTEAFRWTSADGMTPLGDLTGPELDSRAYAASGDGSVIVGYGSPFGAINEAVRWSNASNILGLGLLGSGYYSYANDVSANGSTIVGWSSVEFNFPGPTEAFRWTSSEGMVGLGDLPGGSFQSRAAAISADGAVIAGRGNSSLGEEAMRWTAAEGMTGLGFLDANPAYRRSEATGISADGSVIIGHSARSQTSLEAFRWTSAGGMAGLADLPGGAISSIASDVSADGSVIVGGGTSALGLEAFIWTPSSGMVNLRSLLIASGVPGLTNWRLTNATGISSDGRTIVGFGHPANVSFGAQQAWIVTLPIPEPSTLLLTSLGSATVAVVSIRRRMRGSESAPIDHGLVYGPRL